ncbi:aspartyl-phosphate phosphatase Spo0E family protein [Virgibacillus sp. MSJ-26]|uniref:aspartyl-phosphate phosphatase Spo0E family protein n=1 Tax=Virgibacillus sp. MSJ-26 TaxID=2841522 RepID=UPI001C0F8E8B|nr:aspartyl-phosphate phosphatase Spo0E family protein [Virgibacillus sp. MSJ-26]MBU5465756.1 aspartyl-phosphate phosphatase Spo0E family protein [Virgibacillus sp. MSJ-26]
MKDQQLLKELENKIENMKKEMMDLGINMGLNNSKTLKSSQNLDELIVEYQKRKDKD